jgi:gamma-glutamylcyclotransferase (GGCT)/AIG2-like uncharacterized protein YtfP
MTRFIFVYGTLLQPANPYARYLTEHCSYISSGKVKGVLYDIGEYPGLTLNDKANCFSYGSIYKMDDPVTILQVIDEYEGVGPGEDQPNLYRRVSMAVETPSGILDAWVYLYNLPVNGLEPIPSGNYLEYIKQKKSPGY